MYLYLKLVFFLIFSISSAHVVAQNLKTYEQDLPGSSVKFKMVAIPAGTFTIGSTSSEKGRDDDEGPQKKVQVSAFWMAEKEVTFAGAHRPLYVMRNGALEAIKG